VSGVLGLMRFDGDHVRRSGIARAIGALRSYGPDRSSIYIEGSVGLGHALMRLTPEDSFDNQPVRGASGIVLTADVRLDNRDDILARLGIEAAKAAMWPDSRVLLQAVERFGEEVWALLRGPFAAAIWNPKTRTLTLARDHLGLSPLLWHGSPQFFAFASMPSGLFALEGVPRQLNEEKMADFLVLNHADHRTTVYRDVFRVSPGYVLEVKADGSRVERCFWSAKTVKPTRLRSDQDYAEGLRDQLDRAVRRQMRSAHAIGCLLSGGLDSSAITALAARALAEKNRSLATYTGLPRRGFPGTAPAGCYNDPRPYVEAVRTALANVQPVYVHNDPAESDTRFDRLLLALQGPVRNPTNFGWYARVLQRARDDGRRILLGGLLGNATISWDGWAQTAGHLLRARLPTVYAQWRLYYRLTPHSRWTAFRKLCLEPLVSPALARAFGRDPSLGWSQYSAIRPDFAADAEVDRRARQVGHDFSYRMRPDERTRALDIPDYIGEWNAAEKALTGVDVRDPTADIDVVSYCLGIPAQQYLCEGIDRSLIRRAMWGIVPRCILTNRLHGVQSADWADSFIGRRAELSAKVEELSRSRQAARMIDFSRLRRALENWPDGRWGEPSSFVEYNLAFARGVAAARFLQWFETAN
jgi:asparagine synthase (glutamine-hydrolysing)